MILHSVAFKMGCFIDGHQDCAHVLSTAMFKVTLMCQNHNKTAIKLSQFAISKQ